VAGLGLLLAAAFTKQTALDALLAALTWLALVDRRAVAVAAPVAIGLGLAGVAALEAASGGHFLLNVVAGNANPWNLWQAVVYEWNFARVHLLLGAAALGGLWLLRRARPSVYVVYLAAAALTSLTAGKWGAGESYFLEMLAALAVVSAPCLAALLRAPGTSGRISLALGLVAQVLLYAHGPALSIPGLSDIGFQAGALGAEPGAADVAAGNEIVERYVLKWDGPILAEEPGFVLAAGKPVIGNATHLRNLHEAGVWQADALTRDVQAKRFDFVILNAHLYPRPVLEAIGRHYYLYATVRVSGYNYQVFAPGSE
jgi:hypothetical protein